MTGFESIRKSSAPEMVAEQILVKITSGELVPGSRLPAQRDLARIMGVGRSSVREAINALVVMGYLEAIHGSGTYIRRKLPDGDISEGRFEAALQAGSIFDLMEAREVLECRSAAIAAERADPAQIRKLKAVIERVDAAGGDYAVFLKADMDFHDCLAEATGNIVICEMTRMVLDKVVNHHARLKTARLSSEYRRFSIRSAGKTVESIEQGDGDGAARWMSRHLNAIREELEEVVA